MLMSVSLTTNSARTTQIGMRIPSATPTTLPRCPPDRTVAGLFRVAPGADARAARRARAAAPFRAVCSRTDGDLRGARVAALHDRRGTALLRPHAPAPPARRRRRAAPRARTGRTPPAAAPPDPVRLP